MVLSCSDGLPYPALILHKRLDTRCLRRLYRVNASHGSKLAKEFSSLKQDSEDDRKSLDTIDAVIKDLKTLNDEIEKYIRQTEPAKS